MNGYLDRIEDNKFAVILVEELNKEFAIPKTDLPEGSTEGSYFQLTIENDKVTSMKLDEQSTMTKQTKVADLMTKLRSNSKVSKFKKKG